MAIFLQKKRGQYELIDKTVVSKIIDALELTLSDTVLEIGSGTGVLTFPLRERAAKVYAVEVDKKFSGLVPDVIYSDFLKMDLSGFPPSVKVVSNLPYYITTPIVTKVVPKFDFIVFTMQEEVARRLTAGPGTKEYGAITVYVQFYQTAEIVYHVSKKCFRPVPKVDSCVVRFKKRDRISIGFPEDFLFKVVRSGFSSRRKMIKNNLRIFGNLDGVKADLTRRAETYSINEFCELAGELWKRQ